MSTHLFSFSQHLLILYEVDSVYMYHYILITIIRHYYSIIIFETTSNAFWQCMHFTRLCIYHLKMTAATFVMVVYLPGCASVMFATSTFTYDGGRLLSGLSSFSSASKAAGNLSASEELSLSLHLYGLMAFVIHAMIERCNHSKSSRELFKRIAVAVVTSTIVALPWI